MANERESFFPDTVYHVVHHGNGKENIFRCDDNYYHFLNEYKRYINPIANTFAYCLMPNHFHIGLKIKDIATLKDAFARKAGIKKYENIEYDAAQIEQRILDISDASIPDLISTQFSHFLNAYAKAFNKMYDRKGSVFVDSIYRDSVTTPSYYKNMVRYIHNNPAKHGFCERATDWKHSSIHAYNSLKMSLLERDEVMDWFGGAEAFWGFHQLDDDSNVFQLYDI